MAAASAYAELATIVYIALIWAMILVKAVHTPYGPLVRQVGLRNVVWICPGIGPAFVIYSGDLLEIRSLVIFPRIVCKEYHFDVLVSSLQCVDRI